ncbi:ion transporter [Tepidicaulis sp.]|uniref:ion transporter n=1 Tax=Tepidicaulis sp. TaxID=1920809 RepID=UPI003B5A4586
MTSTNGVSSSRAGGAGRGFALRVVEAGWFQRFIITVILINAVTLGLETSAEAMARAGGLLVAIDRVALSIFVIELLLKFWAYRLSFFKNGWNNFDLAIVAIALVPAAGPLSVLRALRILRVLRLFSVIPSMRKVVQSLLMALPGMGSVAGVLLLIFYIFAVLGTEFFGEAFPEWFGTIGRTLYSLFQIMTLESWSMGIVRPVMEVYPWAWAFFVPFILFTTFMVLNLVIGIIVDSMQMIHESEAHTERETIERRAHEERAAMARDLADIKREIRDLRAALAERRE